MGDADRRYTDRKYLSHKIDLTAKFESFARFVPILNKCAWGSLRTLRFGGPLGKGNICYCAIFFSRPTHEVLSVAQPTDQGEESVVPLLVFFGGGTIFQFPLQFFGM